LILLRKTFITSADHGRTWGEPTHYISSELKGKPRPYARYAGNCIYYAEFRDGKYFKADGALLKDLKKEGPLRPSEAELVYRGFGKPGRAGGLSAVGAAWASSMEVDSKGHPHIGYTLYLSNTGHRYRIASWDGEKWHDREVAYAGKCLYDRESSYVGLITMDPATGKDLGGKHEIYRANIGLGDDVATLKWEAITENSQVRNIRPRVLRDGSTRVVLWNRGDFKTYTDYDQDTVGFVECVK
jgi:hypothetical protein